MDLRQLQALVAVIDHGGFTAAAKATNTVQSNISSHVSKLENELDAVLIDRATGQPTDEGAAVLARARRISNELDAMIGDVQSMQGSPRGTVRVGIIGTTARWLTPLLVNEVEREAPQVKMIVSDGTTGALVARLLDGSLDAVVVALPVDDPDLKTIALFDEDHLVIAPADHPWVELEAVTVEDLSRHRLLLAPQGTGFRSEIDDAFRAAGVQARPRLEVDSLRLLASLAYQGFGAAIVPATAASEVVGGPWVAIGVEGLGQRSVGLVQRRRGMPSSATEAVMASVRSVITREVPGLSGLSLVPS